MIKPGGLCAGKGYTTKGTQEMHNSSEHNGVTQVPRKNPVRKRGLKMEENKEWRRGRRL